MLHDSVMLDACMYIYSCTKGYVGGGGHVLEFLFAQEKLGLCTRVPVVQP